MNFTLACGTLRSFHHGYFRADNMLFSTFLLLLLAVYAARVAFFVSGLFRERSRWTSSEDEPFVSVIVPARNEESNIERCLSALAASDYPKHRHEVIVVNDRSTDGTTALLNALAENHNNLTILHKTSEERGTNLRGKAGALQYGIEHAKGEIILMTDADCAVSPTWLRAMASQFRDPAIGLVSGITSVAGNTFFQWAQDVEWTYTQSMASGAVGHGFPLGCFGNNMAVRKDVFDALGGYRSIHFSVTEDMALQLAVHNAGYGIRYAVHPSIHVETLPCTSFKEYVKQRHRWVRGGTALGIRAAIFTATSIALWLGIALSAGAGMWLHFWSFIVLRLVADSGLVFTAALLINRKRLLPMILPAMTLLMITELSLPLLATRKKVVWKNQVFRG